MKRYISFICAVMVALVSTSCSELFDVDRFIEDEEMVQRETKTVETGTVQGVIPTSGMPLKAVADGGYAPLTIPQAVETAVLGVLDNGKAIPDIFLQAVSGSSDAVVYLSTFRSSLEDGRLVYSAPDPLKTVPWTKSEINIRICSIGGKTVAVCMDKDAVSMAEYNPSDKSFGSSWGQIVEISGIAENVVGFDVIDKGSALEFIVVSDDGSVYFPDMPDINNSLYSGTGVYFGALSNAHLYSLTVSTTTWTADVATLISGDSPVMLNPGDVTVFVDPAGSTGYLVGGRLGAFNYVPSADAATYCLPLMESNLPVTNPCWMNRAFTMPAAGSDKRADIITSGDGALHYYKFQERYSHDGAPVYSSAAEIVVENGELFGGTACVPNVCDWDVDGVLDIVTGNSEGRFLFFKNYGTNKAPAFGAAQLLLVNGQDAVTRSGYYSLDGPFAAAWGYSCPTVCDWNNDGTPDILYGSNSGKVELYLGNGKVGANCLKTKKVITHDGLDIWCHWQVRPAVARIGDDIYFAVMDEDDAVHLYKKATLTTVKDCGKMKLQQGGHITGHRSKTLMSTLTEQGRTKLEFCDWDGDGDFDLLVGTTSVGAFPNEAGIPYSLGTLTSQMLMFENLGDNENFEFATPRLFQMFGRDMNMGTHAVTPTFCELGDATRGPNMLVGTESGKFYFFGRHDLSEKGF